MTEPPADRLRAVVAEFARTQAQYHARARVVEYELAALDPNHYRVILGLRRELTRHVRMIVEAGSADGSFTVPDREGITHAIISLCVDVCRWFPAGRYTDPAKVAKLYRSWQSASSAPTHEQDVRDDATTTGPTMGRYQSRHRP